MSPENVIASLADFSAYVSATLGRSPHTARAYVSDARGFAQFLQDVSSDTEGADPELSDLAPAYLTWLRVEKRNGSATIKRKIAALHVYFSWLVRLGRIERTPLEARGISFKLPKRLPRAVPRCDVIRLLEGCRTTGRGLRGSLTDLAVRVLVSTGVRIGELCSIDALDVSPDGGAIRIKGKGNRERTVFVSNLAVQVSLASACKQRQLEVGAVAAVFINRRGRRMTPQAFRLRLHRLSSLNVLSYRITPHCLRHTAATLLIEAGVDIRFVQRLLGHASIATTEIYTRVVDESLRAALFRADPLRGM
jgi:integrase/recombinase XerD